MICLNRIHRFRAFLPLALIALSTWSVISITSCNLAPENGRAFLNVKKDTAWTKFDSLEITWKDPVSQDGGTLFRGNPNRLTSVNKLPAQDYHGQKILITFTGYQAGRLAYEELRRFDAAHPETVTREILFGGPDGDASLASLEVSPGALIPSPFNPGTPEYSVLVEDTVTAITVTPTVFVATSTLTVNGNAEKSGTAATPVGLVFGSNAVSIEVTARNGSKRTYLLLVSKKSAFIRIAAGNNHSLALKADGKVSAWGSDEFGQVSVPDNLVAKAIAAGDFFSLAIRENGTVAAWGKNDFGQTDVPASLKAKAVTGGFRHALAIKEDGTLVGWGNNDSGQITIPAGLTGVRQVAAGDFFSVALKADSTVSVWGSKAFGQASAPVGLSKVKEIASGFYHTLALKADGTVVAWGRNNLGQIDVPDGLKDVKSVSAWANTSYALKNDGTLIGWGSSSFGQATPPPGLTRVRAISVGGNHVLVIQGDGKVFAWGANTFGQISVPL